MINNIPWTGGTEEEYEMQHFGFGAQRLKIAVRQMIEQNICSSLEEFETHLKDMLNLNDTDKVTLKLSLDKLKKLYFESAEPSLEIIDAEINRMMEIPTNVFLPEDEVQINQFTDSEYSELKQEVNNLKKRIERSGMMAALLSAEEQELSSAEKVCVAAKKDMVVLDMLYKVEDNGESQKKIQNDTLYLCASTPFLHGTEEHLYLDM